MIKDKDWVSISKRRTFFNARHIKKGGLLKLSELLKDYTYTENDIAAYFGFSSRRHYIHILEQNLGLDSERGLLTKQQRRENFNQVYRTKGGITKLIEMLSSQAPDEDIANQFGFEKVRVEKVLKVLGLYRKDFAIKKTYSPREFFDEKYKDKGGIARLEQMAQDPRFPLTDITRQFGYKNASGALRTIQRLGLKYVRANLKDIEVRRERFNRKYQEQGGLKKLEEMFARGASLLEMAKQFGLTPVGIKDAIKALSLSQKGDV